MLAFSASAAVTYVPLMANKLNGSLEPVSSNRVWGSISKWADRTPVLVDTDAEAYCYKVACVDNDERLAVARFVRGLKDLGLWTSAKLITSFCTNHQVSAGATVYSIKGPDLTLTGSPTRDCFGYTFDGTGSAYLSFVNPFSGTIPSISCIQAFKSTPGTYQVIVGGNKNSPNISWSSSVNGSASVGVSANSLVMDYSTNGTAYGAQVEGRYCIDHACTGQRQISCNTYGPALVTQQGNADKQFSTASNYASIYNPSTTWEMARFNGGGAGYLSGELQFVALFDVQLTEAQYLAVRRLFTVSIGGRYLPRANIIFEGDSLTSGSASEVVMPKQMLNNSSWGAAATKRNVAVGGETVAQMKTQVASESFSHAIDNRYGFKTYFVIEGGLNDLVPEVARTAAAIYADLKDIWARGRSLGLIVVACKITPSGNFDSTGIASRLTLNTLIGSDQTLYDYLLDYASVAELSDFNNATYYQSDHVHLTTAGHTKKLDKFVSVIPLP